MILTMLTIHFVLLAVHALGALAAPVDVSQHVHERGGLRVSLTKRQVDILDGGAVNLDLLRKMIGFVISYVFRQSTRVLHIHLLICVDDDIQKISEWVREL